MQIYLVAVCENSGLDFWDFGGTHCVPSHSGVVFCLSGSRRGQRRPQSDLGHIGTPSPSPELLPGVNRVSVADMQNVGICDPPPEAGGFRSWRSLNNSYCFPTPGKLCQTRSITQYFRRGPRPDHFRLKPNQTTVPGFPIQARFRWAWK